MALQSRSNAYKLSSNLISHWLSGGKELPSHLKHTIDKLSFEHSSGISLQQLDSPMMKQFQTAKDEVPDALLFFRMGDFYELFGIDAIIASDVCGLTLTSRDKLSDNPVPMAGTPVVGYRNTLKKCIAAGFKVAVCDQVEDPRKAKGIVKREITRVATPAVPGDLDEDETTESKFGCYLASVVESKKGYTFSYVDVSTGEFRITGFLDENMLIQEILTVEPREILVQNNFQQKLADRLKQLRTLPCTTVSLIDSWIFQTERGRHELFCEFFDQEDQHRFGITSFPFGVEVVCALLHYLKYTQKTVLKNINFIQAYKLSHCLLIDDATRQHLDFFATASGEKKGSLFHFLNRCTTATGSRLLLRRMKYPFKEENEIKASHDFVNELTQSTGLIAELIEVLRSMTDIDRILSRTAQKIVDPRGLAWLRQTLIALPLLAKTLQKRSSAPLLKALLNDHPVLIALLPLTRLLIVALADEPSPFFGKGEQIFRPGYHNQLDEIVSLVLNFEDKLLELEKKEKESSRLSTLKIGYTSAFGYYFEISKGKSGQAPSHFIRKQTLTNCERFITPELKELEEKALSAQEERSVLERNLFEDLRMKVLEFSDELTKASELIAQVDLYVTFAQLSLQYGWCRPEISSQPIIKLFQSTHPILAHLNGRVEPFVTNDIILGVEDNEDNTCIQSIHLITGPNMAGKSTIMRQVAIAQVFCQIGCYVPAQAGVIGIADRIFTRIGSADYALKNQSTFMVEMLETANMLRFATSKSLLLLDEIGRGTSTFDGLSLAWALLEYLHDHVKARTLFSTHYHELQAVCESRKNIIPMHMAVIETEIQEKVGESNKVIEFSRKYCPGGAGKSYGLHVAALAGIPQPILLRAEQILSSLESQSGNKTGQQKIQQNFQKTKERIKSNAHITLQPTLF